MSPYTPGPWFCEDVRIPSPGTYVTTWGIGPVGGNSYIAHVTPPHGDPGDNEANARLMTASPEMYELLHAAFTNKAVVGSTEWDAKTDAALKKARGE